MHEDLQAALEKRGANDRHPYVIGTKAVQNNLTVAEHCARAGKLRAAN